VYAVLLSLPERLRLKRRVIELGESGSQNSDGLRLVEGVGVIIRRVLRLYQKKETTSEFLIAGSRQHQAR